MVINKFKFFYYFLDFYKSFKDLDIFVLFYKYIFVLVVVFVRLQLGFIVGNVNNVLQ